MTLETLVTNEKRFGSNLITVNIGSKEKRSHPPPVSGAGIRDRAYRAMVEFSVSLQFLLYCL